MADGRDDEAEAALRAEVRDYTWVSVRMATPVYDKVCRVANARGTTCSAILRAAVKLFLRNLGHAVELEHVRPVHETRASRRSP